MENRFSQPRSYRDEERQIEEAFQQVAEKKHPPKRPEPAPREVSVSDETMILPMETREPETPVTGETTVLPEEPTPETPTAEEVTAPEPTVPESPVSEEPAAPESPKAEAPATETTVPPVEPTVPESSKAKVSAKPTPGTPTPPAPDSTPIEEVISRRILNFFPEDEVLPDEEEETQSGDLRDVLLDIFQENKKRILFGACALVLLVLMIGMAVSAISNISLGNSDNHIADQVMIAGVHVGGMTKSEAVSAVKKATANTYGLQDMVVNIGGTTLRLSPKDTKAGLDVKAAVDAAYDYGRNGTPVDTGVHTIGLLPYLKLNTDYIRQALVRHANENGSTLTQTSYGLEGKYPNLSADKFDPKSAQTLVLTMGTPGVSFDIDSVYNQILDAYSLHLFEVTAEGVLPTLEPEPVDLQAIYDEFYVEPKDSRLDEKTFEVIPGSYGYEFDMEAAQKMVDAAGYGDVLRIPMVFITPELMEEAALFQDVLGECQTRLSGTQNRITNIRLACKAMNDVVLMPGETFSYNNCLGERTAAKGYKPAPAYVGNQLVDSLGGGICQGSTTLYYSALLADMEIVSRSNHGFPVSYIDYGMDATVSWGGPDFKFRNNTAYPVKIKAAVSDSYLTIQLLGTEKRDYFVKMEYEITKVHEPVTVYEEFPSDNTEGHKDGDVLQEGITGYSVKTYKRKYSRSTGNLISRDFEANSRYTTVNKVVAVVLPPETAPTVPETTVPEITVPETTVPEPTLPEMTVPETTLPEDTVPETTLPSEAVSTETTVPDFPTPSESPQQEPQAA